MLTQLRSAYLIVGAKLGLRWIQTGDLDEIHQFGPATDGVQLRRAFQETGLYSPEQGALAIETLADQRFIGTIQHFPPGPTLHGLEFAYIIHRTTDRGLGYGSEALALFSEFMFFEQPDCRRQQLVIGTENVASWRAAERAGFRQEGRLQTSGAGDLEDSYLYGKSRAA